MSRAPRQKPYHHGDLRQAILDAGEVELAEKGLAAFSLRRVAARVGVSHTAPSHHFGDVAGLIDALAERGLRRLLAAMEARQAGAAEAPFDQLMASGLGYIDFALAHPGLFNLVFGVAMGPDAGPELQQAAADAFMHLASGVAALHGAEPLAHPDAYEQVLACWTRAHGFAGLVLAGHIPLNEPGNPAERDALFARVFGAQFPMQGQTDA
jgi:AcrR family transcriptional regulator